MILDLTRYITSDKKHPEFLILWHKLPNEKTLESDAKKLIAKVSTVLSMADIDEFEITSGWRTQAHNFAIGGAANSSHMTAQAIDISDPDKKLGLWCQSNVESLKDLGLYMESLQKTHAAANKLKRWVHLTIRAPKSGNIIFLP